jgi:predicted RND superfamily exporter protein
MLINNTKDKIRISSRVKDIGADNVKLLSQRIDTWIDNNIDSSVIQFKQTGTGLILDKNSEFVRESLLYGLGLALLIVSVLMGLLFKDFKVLFIALLPNVLPLLFAAALIGYLGIALEAGVSIVFAIIFGIAVDDTIHFMSKYKLAKNQYNDREKALQVTFQETGKAIIFTSIILFFGFLIMLFSANLPSVVIGMLISVTLVSALVADLILLPVVLRWFDI